MAGLRFVVQCDDQPGEALHRAVRAAFVLKGTDLGTWCRENGIARQWAHSVLRGTSTGPAARALIVRILTAAQRDLQ